MKQYLLVLITFCFLGCSSPKKVNFSFFVAGHAYGDPRDKGAKKGLYGPFKDKFQYINSQEKMKLGFLLGDIVWRPNAWPEAQKDISLLKMPIYIVRGNHDGKLEDFENKFGKTYKSFIQDKNLFIILDPNIDKWNISGEQLTFLRNTLRNDTKRVDNIFIYIHQVIWWSKEKLSRPLPNSLQGRAEKTNFWTKIEPLLKNLNKPVFLFAGDVGAFSMETLKTNRIVEYFYYQDNNVTYVSSGMGGGVRDNIVITDVLNDGSVNLRLIPLNGNNVNSLGKLEDYENPN